MAPALSCPALPHGPPPQPTHPAPPPAPASTCLQTSTIKAYGYANDWGVFYGGSGRQLGMQLLGLVVIAAWTCSLSFLMFFALKTVGGRGVERGSHAVQ